MRGICFIGAGKMATAIAGGMVRKISKPKSIPSTRSPPQRNNSARPAEERRSPPLSPHSKTPTRFSLPSNRSI